MLFYQHVFHQSVHRDPQQRGCEKPVDNFVWAVMKKHISIKMF